MTRRFKVYNGDVIFAEFDGSGGVNWRVEADGRACYSSVTNFLKYIDEMGCFDIGDDSKDACE